MERSPFNKETRAKIAVCEAFGLSYWADHPERGRMWAVDDHQQAHVIRWYKTAGYAVLQREGTKTVQERIWPFRRIQQVPTTYDTGQRIAVAV
jgi:hypothetical protein